MKNKKNRNNKILLILPALLLTIQIKTYAGSTKEDKIQTERKKMSTIQSTTDIASLLKKAKQKVTDQNYNQAYKLAQQILMDSRIKLGVSPKVNSRVPFNVPNLLKNVIPVKFKNNPATVQDAIVQHASNLYGGYFSDLTNLYKRATALSVLSSIKLLEQKNGKLLKREQKQFIKRLANVVNIPYHFKDSVNNKTYIVFDSEIFYDDQLEIFNSEIVNLAINNLNIDEENFEKHISELKNQAWEKQFERTFQDKFKLYSNAQINIPMSLRRADKFYERCTYDQRFHNENTTENTKTWVCKFLNYNFKNCVYDISFHQFDGETVNRSIILEYCKHTLLQEPSFSEVSFEHNKKVEKKAIVTNTDKKKKKKKKKFWIF